MLVLFIDPAETQNVPRSVQSMQKSLCGRPAGLKIAPPLLDDKVEIDKMFLEIDDMTPALGTSRPRCLKNKIRH